MSLFISEFSILTFQMVKLFKVENLLKFNNNAFLIYRNGFDEEIFIYKRLIEVMLFVKDRFKALEVTEASCFGVTFKKFTFESIALLVSILDYECNFCPVLPEASHDFLENCGVKYILSDFCFKEKLKAVRFMTKITINKRTFQLYAIKKENNLKLFNDLCYVVTTTGTTGTPKVVHVPYACIAPNIYALSKIFNIKNTDIIYLGTPVTFDPFIVELFMALLTGATLLLVPLKNRVDTESLVNCLWPVNRNSGSVSVLQMTPTNFRQFGLDDIQNKILSKLRILILGGEEFPKRHELLKWQTACSKTRIFNIYGITELSCWGTIYEWCAQNKSDYSPLGKSIDNETVLRIINTSDGKEISGSGQGELLLGSATRKTYIPNNGICITSNNVNEVLYRSTGDLVERSETGDIFYMGRLNNVFKRMGKRVCLDTIEKKLTDLLIKFENVTPVCLWNKNKQVLICCLKLDKKDLLTEIKKITLENLAEYEKPDRIIEVDLLPVNKHNKLDRKALLEEVLRTKNFEKPVEKFKHFLKEILDFGTDKTNVTTAGKFRKTINKTTLESMSFVAAGGSSFQALSLASEIGENLVNANDQRTLLKMLLDTNAKIFNILSFLDNVKSNPYFDLDSKMLISSTLYDTIPKRFELKIIWHVFMEKCIDAAPAIYKNDRYVCIGSHAGLLLTLKALTGEVVSRFQLCDRIECQVAFVSPDLALVGCDAGYLYGFNYLKGNLEWSLQIGNQIKAKPLIIDSTLALIGCYDIEFNLVAVCLKNQKFKWRKKVGTRPIFASPILLNTQKAIICTLDGTFENLNVKTGKVLWTQKCNSPIFSTPCSINNGNEFIIAEVEGKVHICNSSNGQILQTFLADGNIFSNIIAFQSETSTNAWCIIFGCHDHHVYCLNRFESNDAVIKSCLELKWKTKLNAAIFASPILFKISNENYIIACSTKGLLTILESITGAIVNNHNFKNEIFSTPCYITRYNENKINIYIGCRDNYFYCVQLKNK